MNVKINKIKDISSYLLSLSFLFSRYSKNTSISIAAPKIIQLHVNMLTLNCMLSHANLQLSIVTYNSGFAGYRFMACNTVPLTLIFFILRFVQAS